MYTGYSAEHDGHVEQYELVKHDNLKIHTEMILDGS